MVTVKIEKSISLLMLELNLKKEKRKGKILLFFKKMTSRSCSLGS